MALFDASEFIDPAAISASLNEVQNYQLPAPQQQQQPRQPMQAGENIFPQQQQQDNGSNGLIGMIMNMF